MKKIKKQKFSFYFFLYFALLTLFCFYGWYKVNDFIAEFEASQIRESVSGVDGQMESYEVPITPLTSEEIDKLQEYFTKISREYALFVGDRLEFDDISVHYDKGSHIFRVLSEFNNNRFTNFDYYRFAEEKIEKIELLSDFIVLGEVSLHFIITIGTEEYIYPSHYCFYLDRETTLITDLILK